MHALPLPIRDIHVQGVAAVGREQSSSAAPHLLCRPNLHSLGKLPGNKPVPSTPAVSAISRWVSLTEPRWVSFAERHRPGQGDVAWGESEAREAGWWSKEGAGASAADACAAHFPGATGMSLGGRRGKRRVLMASEEVVTNGRGATGATCLNPAKASWIAGGHSTCSAHIPGLGDVAWGESGEEEAG